MSIKRSVAASDESPIPPLGFVPRSLRTGPFVTGTALARHGPALKLQSLNDQEGHTPTPSSRSRWILSHGRDPCQAGTEPVQRPFEEPHKPPEERVLGHLVSSSAFHPLWSGDPFTIRQYPNDIVAARHRPLGCEHPVPEPRDICPLWPVMSMTSLTRSAWQRYRVAATSARCRRRANPRMV